MNHKVKADNIPDKSFHNMALHVIDMTKVKPINGEYTNKDIGLQPMTKHIPEVETRTKAISFAFRFLDIFQIISSKAFAVSSFDNCIIFAKRHLFSVKGES